tara:strand:- start:184 stop:879 length:696 start_codon:yes stop_codon:yes gene_type:complete
MDELEKRRQKAKDIYLTLYDQNSLGGRLHYGGKNWGSGAYGYIQDLEIDSFVDVGCGRNDFANWGVNQGINAVGVDIACPLADFVCSSRELPFKDKKFEYVTSFDMMEHLLPEEVDDTLDEFFRVASKGFLFTISYKRSNKKVDGKQIHLTIQKKEWWLNKISQYGKINFYRGVMTPKNKKGQPLPSKILEYIHCSLYDTKVEPSNFMREENQYFLDGKLVETIISKEVQN